MKLNTQVNNILVRFQQLCLSQLCLSLGAVLFFTAVVTLSINTTADANQIKRTFDASKNRWIEVPVSTSSTQSSDDIEEGRRIIDYQNNHPVGTIVIDTSARHLFRTLGKGQALRYTIGVGREGFTWKGRQRVSRKTLWPTWTPPKEMRQREAKKGKILPERMEGGPDNPMGARAIYLGNTLYRIHGTNQPWTVGKADSSGCIRMTNQDVIHLFETTKVGALVIVR